MNKRVSEGRTLGQRRFPREPIVRRARFYVSQTRVRVNGGEWIALSDYKFNRATDEQFALTDHPTP